MSWNVEYTDEFGAWWSTLADGIQDDITAIVEVLMERGPQLPFPYRRALPDPVTIICASCGCKAVASRSAFSTPSIQRARRSSWSAATRQVVIVSTRK